MALNYLVPYTQDIYNDQVGLHITEVLNSRRKKQLKPHEVFPYLKGGVPDWLSDDTVKKARQLIANAYSTAKLVNCEPKLDGIYKLIREEIEIELDKQRFDSLKIKQLKDLLPS